MQIIACQHDIEWENRPENLKTAQQLLSNTKIEAGALICFPEMFSTGYSMKVDRVVEKTESETEAFLSETARLYKSWTMGGLVYQGASNDRGINALAVFGPDGKRIGIYKKNHCFSYAHEDEHYEPGNDILIFDWNGFQVCPTICYDLRFPELFRRAIQSGANLFVVIANWPSPRIDHWNTLLKARAIENQAMVVGVNRVGSDPTLTFNGGSMIIDARGRILAEADEQVTCLAKDISVDATIEWRKIFPALKDMKTDAPTIRSNDS